VCLEAYKKGVMKVKVNTAIIDIFKAAGGTVERKLVHGIVHHIVRYEGEYLGTVVEPDVGEIRMELSASIVFKNPTDTAVDPATSVLSTEQIHGILKCLAFNSDHIYTYNKDTNSFDVSTDHGRGKVSIRIGTVINILLGNMSLFLEHAREIKATLDSIGQVE
jgi:hypothetical protein